MYLKKKERKKLWGKRGNIEGKEHINKVRKQEYAIFYVIESKMCSFLKRVKVGEIKKQSWCIKHINKVRKQEYAIFYVIESKMCSFLKRVKVGEVKKQKLMCNNIVGRASF